MKRTIIVALVAGVGTLSACSTLPSGKQYWVDPEGNVRTIDSTDAARDKAGQDKPKPSWWQRGHP
jgi:hypothetical protein